MPLFVECDFGSMASTFNFHIPCFSVVFDLWSFQKCVGLFFISVAILFSGFLLCFLVVGRHRRTART